MHDAYAIKSFAFFMYCMLYIFYQIHEIKKRAIDIHDIGFKI